MNAFCTDRPVRRPFAEIQCLPGMALAGTESVIGPKWPRALVRGRARPVLTTKQSTHSEAPNPDPFTRTRLVGGPTVVDSETVGATVDVAALCAAAAGVD